ncbi:hypothetical protein F7R23_29325, partial [Burkholderia diffusa]
PRAVAAPAVVQAVVPASPPAPSGARNDRDAAPKRAAPARKPAAAAAAPAPVAASAGADDWETF